MADNFNLMIRGAYESSRAKSARRMKVRDPAELDAADVRTAAVFAGASVEEADAIARRHAALHGDDFNALIRNDHAAAVGRRRKI